MNRSLPAINVFNRQRKYPVDLVDLEEFSRRLAGRLDLSRGFSVMLVNDRAMRGFNRRFRNRPGATDVLSFPDQRESWEPRDHTYAGDIVISVETAERQRRGRLEEELKLLSLHGLLHLLGYDHETDHGKMNNVESRLRKEFGLP